MTDTDNWRGVQRDTKASATWRREENDRDAVVTQMSRSKVEVFECIFISTRLGYRRLRNFKKDNSYSY